MVGNGSEVGLPLFSINSFGYLTVLAHELLK
jgi:hypothetical protein